MDGFSFSKGKKPKPTKAPAVRNSAAERTSPAKAPPVAPSEPAPAPPEEPPPKPAPKKVRRRLPTTPERDAAEKPVRRSKRLSDEHEAPKHQDSPHKPAHAKSHANHERSPSPNWARPVTVEKKRRRDGNGVEDQKVMRIQLPFADTPVIKRNKEMRKASAETGSRRSSSGMRGRRASSLIDEGRGNGKYSVVSPSTLPVFPDLAPLHAEASEVQTPAVVRSHSCPEPDRAFSDLSTPPPSEETDTLTPQYNDINAVVQHALANNTISNSALPHSEVSTADFFKHISAELTEPRRMRCLLGWCGSRALPSKPEAPKDSSAAANLEFQALQAGMFYRKVLAVERTTNKYAARIIQEELSQDLTTKGILSDWFSRDDSAPPQIPLRKKPNPRNIANAAKAEELERELER